MTLLWAICVGRNSFAPLLPGSAQADVHFTQILISLQAQWHGGIIHAVHMTHSKLELFQIRPKAFHTLQDCMPSSTGNFPLFFQWYEVALLQGVIVFQ